MRECFVGWFLSRKGDNHQGPATCAEVSTMMVMVTTRLDPALEARISLCMCMTPLGNAVYCVVTVL